MVGIQRLDRICCLFPIAEQVPNLELSCNRPVSRHILALVASSLGCDAHLPQVQVRYTIG